MEASQIDKPYYVTFTGTKNNAGDFLIRYKGHEVIEKLRPDRMIINFNAWEILSDENLAIVNKSKAIILLGGPALTQNFYPGVYKLRENLENIKVPIYIMGAGWKSSPGYWSESSHYKFTEKATSLLNIIQNQNSSISVRDYRTANALFSSSYKDNVYMTGCPVLYDFESMDQEPLYKPLEKIKNVSFSLGVGFVTSPSAELETKKLLLAIKDLFKNSELSVGFHHSLNKEVLAKSYPGNTYYPTVFYQKHLEFIEWLQKESINYTDISGSSESMIEYYNSMDFHIGQRVHAHLFSVSKNIPSVLITEDGRGRGMKEVLGGLIFDLYVSIYKPTIVDRIQKKIGRKKLDPLLTNHNLTNEIVNNIKYEFANNFIRIKQARINVNNSYKVMKDFIKSLP